MMEWLFLGLVLALFGYEGVAIYQQRGETISEIIWRLSRRPILPFAFGILMGHFFAVPQGCFLNLK